MSHELDVTTRRQWVVCRVAITHREWWITPEFPSRPEQGPAEEQIDFEVKVAQTTYVIAGMFGAAGKGHGREAHEDGPILGESSIGGNQSAADTRGNLDM